MPVIYFAGPLFCEAERIFNAKLTTKLENIGFTVFLPQREHGSEVGLTKLRATPPGIKEIFDKDIQAVSKADIFLFILDGRVPDEGACVELGVAYAQKVFNNKNSLIIGLKTDFRIYAPNADLNLMLSSALDQVAKTEEELLTILQNYLKGEIKN